MLANGRELLLAKAVLLQNGEFALRAEKAALEAERAREAGYASHVKQMYEVSRQQAAQRAFQQRQDAQIAKCERKMQAREHRSREIADQKRIMDQKVTDQFLGKFGHLQA